MDSIQPDQQKFKVCLYARVSTDDKDQNPENQLFKLREYCKNVGWEIAKYGNGTPIEYIDYESGKDISITNRKQFLLMFTPTEQALWDGIVVLREDRWSREIADGFTYAKRVAKAGKFLYVLDKDTMINKKTINTAKVTVVFGMSMMMAQLERQVLSARVKEAYDLRKAKADDNKERVVWGKKRFLVKDAATGKYTKEIDPKRVKELHAKGYSIRDIARELGCSTMPIVKILKGDYDK